MRRLSSTAFDFETSSSAGWSTGSGDPPYAFTRRSGATSSSSTGPSAGYGGSGNYYYAEATGGSPGDLFTLAYDGSACSASGQVVATVAFPPRPWAQSPGYDRSTCVSCCRT